MTNETNVTAITNGSRICSNPKTDNPFLEASAGDTIDRLCDILQVISDAVECEGKTDDCDRGVAWIINAVQVTLQQQAVILGKQMKG